MKKKRIALAVDEAVRAIWQEGWRIGFHVSVFAESLLISQETVWKSQILISLLKTILNLKLLSLSNHYLDAKRSELKRL